MKPAKKRSNEETIQERRKISSLMLLGLENMVGKLMVYNALSMDFETYKVKNNKNCEYCGCQGTEKYPEYSNYSESCTI